MTQSSSAPNPKALAKIESLQVLRALAAAAVMFFHGTSMIEKSHGYLFLDGFFDKGFAGVDLFFVISGFIIYHTTAGTGISRREFLRRRLIRIYPIYWVVTLILLVYYVAVPSPRVPVNAGSVLASFALAPSSHYLLGVAWTLVIEIAFYALFAITYFIHPRVFFVSLATWGIASVIVGPVLGLAAGHPVLELWMFSGSLEFGYGVVIALLYRHGVSRGAHAALALGLGLGALTWFDVAWWGAVPMERELQYGLPAALILYGAVHSTLRFPAWLILVGDASYVLYLIHASALSNLMRLSDRLGLPAWYATAVGGLVLYALVVIASCIVHKAVELPLTRWLKARIPAG